MCGIVGMVGIRESAPAIFNSLKKLEYRGYDSAGMAMCVNSHIEVRKGVGRLSQVEETCHLSRLPGVVGIGHVRWATHGGVTIENSHPHLDCRRKIAVVHNGIIENYRELRDRLEKEHTFTSETDTEVIVHLIEEGMKTNLCLEKAVFEAVKQLRGSYALLAITSSEPHKLVAARRDSPLVIGLGEHFNYAASDTLCFLDQTRRAVFIEDGEIVVLTQNEVRILDTEYREISREPVLIEFSPEAANKQGYDYYMLKEIREQPQAIRQSIIQDKKAIMDMSMEILRAKQIVFTACGTSRHAALIGRYVFSKLGGKFSDVVMSSEFQYFTDSIDKNTLVIAISQSGETADVINGIKKAKANGAKIFSLVNVQGSTLARMSDRSIYLHCGPEICVAATKSFISQMAIFYLLGFAMVNRLDEGIQKLTQLSYLISDNININNQDLEDLAVTLKSKKDFYFLGRGINFAIAMEGALKLKEISYIHAEGMPAGELKHGTLALVESKTPVLGICPNDYTYDEMISNLLETKARGSFVIGVSDRPNPAFEQYIPIPTVEEIFYPLVSVIPLQILAYYSAVARGFDPDKPRNLAKSVTVK
jgi:glutamine---fructose-6-phosphate transaminase (isomerizing)